MRLYERSASSRDIRLTSKLSDALGRYCSKKILSRRGKPTPPFEHPLWMGYAIIKKDFEDAPESQFFSNRAPALLVTPFHRRGQ